jgi:hypothetical protein
MTKSKLLAPAHEMRVLALIAKGDDYVSIQEEILEEFGRSIAVSTISKIKRRYADVLAQIKSQILQYEEATAQQLLDKSRQLIGKRLSVSEIEMKEYYRALNEFERGEISFSDFKLRTEHFKLPTLQELTTVSKEMSAQSGNTPAIPQGSSSSEVARLIKDAVDKGDTVSLERIIFNVDDQTSSETSSVPVSTVRGEIPGQDQDQE